MPWPSFPFPASSHAFPAFTCLHIHFQTTITSNAMHSHAFPARKHLCRGLHSHFQHLHMHFQHSLFIIAATFHSLTHMHSSPSNLAAPYIHYLVILLHIAAASPHPLIIKHMQNFIIHHTSLGMQNNTKTHPENPCRALHIEIPASSHVFPAFPFISSSHSLSLEPPTCIIY